MKLHMTRDGVFAHVHWEEFGEAAFLSFKIDAMSEAEMRQVFEAAANNDIGEVCNLWDSFVVRWR